MEKHYLIRFKDNYCDEFDVQGFSLITSDQYKMYKFVVDNVNKYYGSYTVGIGSNEEIEYQTLTEFLSCIKVSEISTNDYKTINAYFGKNYGLVYPISEIEFIAEELT